MKLYKTLFCIGILYLCCQAATAQTAPGLQQQDPLPEAPNTPVKKVESKPKTAFKIGYANTHKNFKAMQGIETGLFYGARYDATSYGFSGTVSALIQNSKMYIVPKISAEASLAHIGIKGDISVITNNFYVTPNAGIIFGKNLAVYLGYNLLVYNSNGDSYPAKTQFSVTLNIEI